MIAVRDIQFVGAPRELRDSGLLGWVSFTLWDAVRIDGVQVRRTRLGDHRLSFPAHTDSAGTKHPYVRPLHDGVRRAIEREVFSALSLSTESAP